jgi:hypothetical protein
MSDLDTASLFLPLPDGICISSVHTSVTELVVHIACWHPCAACPLCQQPQAKDGDAAFLDIGTRMYTVKGYLPTFRLAAYLDGMLQLYEADTNPRARTGADLLDIAGKVRYIGITSEQDGVTELGAIRNARQVAALVALILQAPVNQQYVSQGSTRYFIALHLLDGTAMIRSHWLDSGESSRGMLLPSAFKTAIEQALQQRKSRP